MTTKPASMLALVLLGCGPSGPAEEGNDEIGEDESSGEDESTGDGDEEHEPLYLLTEGSGAVWVVDVTEPGTVEAAKIIPESEEFASNVVASSSSRWAAIVTTAFGNSSSSVWLHDFVGGPLEAAVEIPIDPTVSTPAVWFAADESGLAIETRIEQGTSSHIVYVPLAEQGPGSPIEIPDVPGFPYDGGFAGGSHLILRITDAGNQELFVVAIVDGQPQAPVRLPEFDGLRGTAKWRVSGTSLFYDTIDPVSLTGQLHRVDLSAWPEHAVETLGPFDWAGGNNWWLAKDGSRLIVDDEDAMQVAEVGDAIGDLQPLPGATDFLALSDDGRFGLVRAAQESEDVHELLGFDFESASPLDPHALGSTRSNVYDVAFGGDWVTWTTGDCSAAGVDLSGDLGEVVELTDVDNLSGFTIAPATTRLYSRGVTYPVPIDPLNLPEVELSFRDLGGDSPGPTTPFDHPFDEGTRLAGLVASPVDARHFYEVVDEDYTNGVLWEHDPDSGVRTPIGALSGQFIDSLWVPGSSASRPIGFHLGTNCGD